MSKEKRKKMHWGSKGKTTAVQNLGVRCSVSCTFWHYHPCVDLNSNVQT